VSKAASPYRLLALIFLLTSPLRAENRGWKFQGFWESRAALYLASQARGNPVSEASSHFHGAVRYQTHYFSLVAKPELWIDTRRTIDRRSVTLSDRTDRRPVAAAGELYLDLAAMGLDFRLGKQQIFWGRADTWNPTDNITPFDYLDLLDAERLGIAAVRIRRYFGASSLDLVWTPLFTPTRLPLPDAIVVATALHTGAALIVTNDRRLASRSLVPAVVVDDYLN
jgi:hypothetical protein